MKIISALSVLTFSFALSAMATPSSVVPSSKVQRKPFNEDVLGKNSVMCLLAQKMEVHGHRGLGGFPNNTLSSFRAGYDAGADVAELDLQITADNHILVAHDAVPNVGTERCSLHGKSLEKTSLRELPFAEASQIRCGDRLWTESFTDSIPELSAVFAAFKDRKSLAGKPVRLNIEIKYFKDQVQYYPPQDEYLNMILKVIRDSGWSTDRFFVQSFNHDILKVLKSKAPDIEFVPLIWDARDALKAALDVGSSIVTSGFPQLTPEVVYQIHQKNVRVISWTPNSVEELKWVIASGADGVITDRADLFMQIRRELCE
ncbi:glycerophosphodiester phosphodiesterase family protein [Bdellovibrio sp. NC01]|uniref:glycerophosphodiester phosphodiesterase family protein n=1 Tax=Bdellovibrio sp. NC01 TaxID=2220073 RepID=UPI001FEFD2ED|nr:glycerophosphodiester phosphodiesterase family protein [Bdellovibrio sp. NC01]